MSKKTKYTLVGEGDDRINIHDWDGELAAPLQTIAEIRSNAETYGLEIDWRQVTKGMPRFRQAFAEYLEDGRELYLLLDRHPAVSIRRKHWGGESPGRSGIWIKVYVRADKLVKLGAELDQLAARLEDHFQELQQQAEEEEEQEEPEEEPNGEVPDAAGSAPSPSQPSETSREAAPPTVDPPGPAAASPDDGTQS